jgi:hypothetical protein
MGKDWSRPLTAKEYLLDLISKLEGDLSDIVKRSSGRLQQSLMALRRGAFEEIQQEAPFSRIAQANMARLLRAWEKSGKAGFTQVWERIFHPGWESERKRQDPIQIVADVGDCAQRALEIIGARDGATRVAAEW